MINTIVTVEPLKDFSEQGFFSNSYLGKDVRLNREVAVKDIKVKGIVSEEGLETYFQEATKLSLATHPRILPVYFVGLVDDGKGVLFPRIITKYLKNGSLNEYLEKCFSEGVSPSLEQLIRFSHEIIQGLIHLHSLNILHLDLKASNIFIGDDEKLVIADFGLSKFINEEVLKDVGHLYPVLNPPENLTLKYVDKTADIYQFGVLLYSMFNYDIYRKSLVEDYKVDTKAITHLFNLDVDSEDFKALKKDFNKNMKQLGNDIKNGEFPNRNFYNDFVPKEIKELINTCLQVNVEDRYNNFMKFRLI